MSPYTIRVGNRDEMRFDYDRGYSAVKAFLAEVREQARRASPRSVALYHYGELVAEW